MGEVVETGVGAGFLDVAGLCGDGDALVGVVAGVGGGGLRRYGLAGLVSVRGGQQKEWKQGEGEAFHAGSIILLNRCGEEPARERTRDDAAV